MRLLDPRKFRMFTTVLTNLFLIVGLSAQVAPPSSEAVSNIGGISVIDRPDTVSIEIHADASLNAPRILRLSHPDRLVFDFIGAVPKAGFVQQKVNKHSISNVRMAIFQRDTTGHPITRVVVDLLRPTAYQTERQRGKFVITLGDERIVDSTKNVRRSLTAPPRNISPPESPVTTAATREAMVPRIPKVSYSNGLLSIEADNSALSDVIFAVAEKTGAAIDMPFSDGMLDRVTFTMGPAKPRDIVATLLEGSRYNYYIVEDRLGGLQKIILAPK